MPDVWLWTYVGMFPAREDADDHDLSPCYVRLRDYRALLSREAQVRREALEEAFSVIADYPRVAPEKDEWVRYDEQIEHSQGIIRSLIDATHDPGDGS